MCFSSKTSEAPTSKPSYSVSEMGDNFDLSMTDEKGKTTPIKRKAADAADQSPVASQSGINMKV